MSRPAEEMLYMAMEDFRVDVVIGKGPGATAIPLEIPPFTLVGATTRAGLLPGRCATGSASPRTSSCYEADELDHEQRRRTRRGLLLGGREPDDRAGNRRRSPRASRGQKRPASPTASCAGSATTPRWRADGIVTP
jgi:Holliday junction DNA helicase RuvB